MKLPQSKEELFYMILERKRRSKVSFIEAIYDFVDEYMMIFFRETKLGHTCRAGCNLCCYQPIVLTPLECSEIQKYLSLLDDTDIKMRFLAEKQQWIEWCNLFHESSPPQEGVIFERWKGKSCVFLNPLSNFCDIYPVRALVCRLTFNLQTCTDFSALRLDKPEIKWSEEILEDIQTENGRSKVFPLMSFLTNFYGV